MVNPRRPKPGSLILAAALALGAVGDTARAQSPPPQPEVLPASKPTPSPPNAGRAEDATQKTTTTTVHTDTLYGALILATNGPEEGPAELPLPLRPHARQLGAFGYTHYRLLGEKAKNVPNGTEDWLVPSPRFGLRVDTKSRLPDGTGYELGLQLLQENRLLREVDYKLRRDHPLFIRGPMVGAGQLIVLLAVM